MEKDTQRAEIFNLFADRSIENRGYELPVSNWHSRLYALAAKILDNSPSLLSDDTGIQSKKRVQIVNSVLQTSPVEDRVGKFEENTLYRLLVRYLLESATVQVELLGGNIHYEALNLAQYSINSVSLALSTVPDEVVLPIERILNQGEICLHLLVDNLLEQESEVPIV